MLTGVEVQIMLSVYCLPGTPCSPVCGLVFLKENFRALGLLSIVRSIHLALEHLCLL